MGINEASSLLEVIYIKRDSSRYFSRLKSRRGLNMSFGDIYDLVETCGISQASLMSHDSHNYLKFKHFMHFGAFKEYNTSFKATGKSFNGSDTLKRISVQKLQNLYKLDALCSLSASSSNMALVKNSVNRKDAPSAGIHLRAKGAIFGTSCLSIEGGSAFLGSKTGVFTFNKDTGPKINQFGRFLSQIKTDKRKANSENIVFPEGNAGGIHSSSKDASRLLGPLKMTKESSKGLFSRYSTIIPANVGQEA